MEEKKKTGESGRDEIRRQKNVSTKALSMFAMLIIRFEMCHGVGFCS